MGNRPLAQAADVSRFSTTRSRRLAAASSSVVGAFAANSVASSGRSRCFYLVAVAMLGSAMLPAHVKAQIALTEVTRYNLTTARLPTTPNDEPNPLFIGNNTNAVAWDGSRLFVAGFNNGGSGTSEGIIEITNTDATGIVTSANVEYGTRFGSYPAADQRGYIGLALSGNSLFAALDLGEALPASVAPGMAGYDISSATPTQTWGLENVRGGVNPDMDPGYVVSGSSQGGAGLAWGTFGEGNALRGLLDPATGAAIYGFTPGSVPLGMEWREPVPATPLFPRALSFDPNTGDVYGRTGNWVTKAARTGPNETATPTVLWNTFTGQNVLGQNLAFMSDTVAGDLVAFNIRDDSGIVQSFTEAVQLIDTNGAVQTIDWNFLGGPDYGNAPIQGPVYDFAFDPTTQTLAVLGNAGSLGLSIFRFGSPEKSTRLEWAADGATRGGDGIWDTSSLTWIGAYGPEAWNPPARAIFTGSTFPTSTITVAAGGASVGDGMSFVTDGYLIQGDTITLDGATAFINNAFVEQDVTATITAGLVAPNGASKSGAGTLVVGGPIDAGQLFVNNGTLTIAPTVSIVNQPPDITILAPGTLDVTQLPLGLGVAADQAVAGAGTVAGSLTLFSGATVSPGSNLGTLTVTQDLNWASGGNYNWQIVDAAGTAGSDPGWDLLSVGGVLDIAATTAEPFQLNLWSLSETSPDLNGDAANFSPTQGYTWTIASAAGGITGFSADAFVINTAARNGAAGFSNDLGGGTFSLAVSGTDLNLVFSPGSGPSDIVIDVASGSQTQAEAGYPTIASASSVTKTGAGTLVFDAANAYAGPTTVSAGTLQVANAAAVAASNVTVDTGATLAIASGTTMQSPAVIVDGGTLAGGAVAVNPTTGIASLAINAGTISGSPAVSVTGGGQMSLVQDARVTVSVGGLSVDQAGGGGRLDLGAGQVNIAAGGISASDLRADIIAGRSGGAWTGTSGIMSSTAAASGGTRAVGYVVAGDGSAKVSFAAAGDVDLSGQVNVFDLVSINSSGKYGAGTASVWSQGDFNYDGVTNVFDLVGINTAAIYGQGNYFPAAPSVAGGIATVPEPGGLMAAAAGLAAAIAISRRLRPPVDPA